MTHTTTRRGALATFGQAAVMGAIPAALVGATAKCTASANAATIDRGAWDRAMTAYEKAKAECTSHNNIATDVYQRTEAGRPDINMIPWKEFPFVDRQHVAHRADIDDMQATWLAAENKTWWGGEPAKRRMLAAFDKIREYRRLAKANEARHDFDAVMQRQDRLGDAESEAWGVVLATPAPDHAALLWKLEELYGEPDKDGFSDGWSADIVGAFMADARRLLSGGLN